MVKSNLTRSILLILRVTIISLSVYLLTNFATLPLFPCPSTHFPFQYSLFVQYSLAAFVSTEQLFSRLSLLQSGVNFAFTLLLPSWLSVSAALQSSRKAAALCMAFLFLQSSAEQDACLIRKGGVFKLIFIRKFIVKE